MTADAGGFEHLWFDEDLSESPRLAGTRVSMVQVYEMHVLAGFTVDEIAKRFEAVSVDAVKEALQYAVTHPDEVREQATSELTKAIVERQARSQATA